MKGSKYFVACLLAVLVGVILGLLLADMRRDRISKFNITLLEAVSTNTLVAPLPGATNGIYELLTIWRAMEAIDRRLDSEVKKQSLAWRLGEGILARNHATERLAPAIAGILQSRGLSLTDYFQLEDEIARHVSKEGTDPRVGFFRSLMEERSPVIHGVFGNLGIKASNRLSTQEWITLREPVSQFLGSNYARLSDIDLELLVVLVRVSAKAK